MQMTVSQEGPPTGIPVAARRDYSRRAVLAFTGAAGAAMPFTMFGLAHALTAFEGATIAGPHGSIPICRVAAPGESLEGRPHQLTLAWNASSICTLAGPVAKERGVFAKRNLNVDFVNFGGSTEQLLEAIATGKADAGIGMALRWLKPLEQGFDVRIAAGVHGGCMRLLGAKSKDIVSLESLRGKSIAISDQASPAKNFFSIALAKNGMDPIKDVEWRQYPAELLALAVAKGEADALADNDPRTYLWFKDGTFNEVATNLSSEYASRICCVLAIRGSLVREERPVAIALTRAVLEAGDLVAHDPVDAAVVYSGYGGKGSVEDLTAMLRSHTHHNHPVGAALKEQIAIYADELRQVNVMKRSTDPDRFAERVCVDLLT
jgi:NitT/TauT family transport system substrate-binding protein